jgi:hypothetical protein
MAHEHIHSDLLIVGAGLSGLMAAQSFTQQGIKTLLVEKNERVGGRLSTAEIDGNLADLGAQYFTVRNAQFRLWLERWLDEGLAFEWAQSWSDGSLSIIPFDRHPRYAIRGGMVALAEYLARDQQVSLNTRLTAITRVGNGWQAQDDRGRVFSASALLLTPPVPISLQLLDAGRVTLSADNRAALNHLVYEPCVTGLFEVEGSIRLPEPGAIQRASGPIIWIADNRRKGLSPDKTLITVQATTGHSRDLWPRPDWEILVALEAGLRPHKVFDTRVIASYLERWLYSMPAQPHPDRYLQADGVPPLVFAGDSFGAPRMEGAALSGMAAAKAMIAQINAG